MHGLANLSGIVAPTLTGIIIQSTGTFSSGFGLAGILGVFGALVVAFFVSAPKSPQAVAAAD